MREETELSEASLSDLQKESLPVTSHQALIAQLNITTFEMSGVVCLEEQSP